MKYMSNIFYIYLGIIAINLCLKLLVILLGVDTGSIPSFISNMGMETGEDKIILKIHEGKENLDFLLQTQEEVDTKSKSNENNKNLDLVNEGNKEYKCIEKNINPLKDIHKRLLSADKSYFPSYFQKNSLPKEDLPVYGNKLVSFKPSSILQNRNLPEMSIEIPKSTSIGKLTELHKAIDGADEAVKLYDSQYFKFNKVLFDIKNGTEEFYPNEAKPLMETYVDLVTELSNQQKVMANQAINELQKLESNFSRDLYIVKNTDDMSGTATIGVSPDRDCN
jgi:hypothetical protein